MIFDDVRELTLDGFRTTSAIGSVPPMVLTGTRDVWISGAVAPIRSKALVGVEGSGTSNLLISGCDLRGAAQLAEISAEVKADAVRGEFNIAHDKRGDEA